jgi:hypothetical protein
MRSEVLTFVTEEYCFRECQVISTHVLQDCATYIFKMSAGLYGITFQRLKYKNDNFTYCSVWV